MSLNEEQKAALEQFRQKVSDVLPKDKLENERYLLNWLRARKFSVPKAEAMLRNDLNDRKQYDVDNVLTKYQLPEVLQKHGPTSFIGFDKQGNGIIMILIKEYDKDVFKRCVKKTDRIKYIYYHLENCVKQVEENNKKTGLDARCAYIILDLEGLTVGHITTKQSIDVFIELATIAERNYPEQLGKLVLLNVNKLFNVGLNLVRPFIVDEIYAKFCFFGENDKSWKQMLLNDIDADVLPKYWGGNRTGPDGDPACRDLISWGGKVPKDYFLTSSEKGLADLEGLETIVVNSGGTALVEADIQEAGAFLKWVFGTDGHDIAFGLYRKTPQGLEEHIQKVRVESHLSVEEGELQCIETGTYVFAFDNSHSMVRSKTVKFQIQVLSPDKLE